MNSCPNSFTQEDLKQLIKPHQNSPFVFLETASFNKKDTTSFLFTNLSEIITFNYGDDLDLFFKKLENILKKGFWLCGYFSYEFGYFLEPALYSLREEFNFPLVWLGVCRNPLLINHQKYQSNPRSSSQEDSSYTIKNLMPNISRGEYTSSIREIKKYLEEGLTYQVNFTFKIKFDFAGDLIDFYLNLRRAQPTSYMAFINTGNSHILSLSPELFFCIEKNEIISRPMKGTISRGLYCEGDKKNKIRLRRSKKIKAENVMIVDLLRNDLGKISNKVGVLRLFDVERYRTLYQMTSTIKAQLKGNIKIKDVFSSLFPCGSVTGAPKIKTIQIIKGLEKEPRGIYTGAIGYISPQKRACFNVAIRTAQIKNNRGELGIGGGIVYDSIDKNEYEEAILKAKFAVEKFPNFSLIETILWEEDKGYYLLDLHLKRLRKSCGCFSIPLDFKKLKENLKGLEKNLGPGNFKVRILLDMEGKINLEKESLEKIFPPVKVKLCPQRINPRNLFLYHKTTQRNFYDEERKKAQRDGFFEVIFLNIYGELTEGAITNLFLLKEGCLYTPPQQCGLLGGVLREHFLKKGKAKEKVLYLENILEADKIYLGNSVRGLIEAKVYLANSEKKSKIRAYA